MENYKVIIHRAVESEDELMHYGVKGQKWGVRRYQNKDGSLTAAGKKRVRESGTLGFPSYDRKKKQWKGTVKNRLAIQDIYDKELDDTYGRERAKILNDKNTLKKAGYIFTDKPDSDVREHNSDIVDKLLRESKTIKAAQRKATERFIDQWADATIADLELKNTEQTKAFVTDYIVNSSTYAHNILGYDDAD